MILLGTIAILVLATGMQDCIANIEGIIRAHEMLVTQYYVICVLFLGLPDAFLILALELDTWELFVLMHS